MVSVHGLQLSVHGWKNQRIIKFIVKILIRLRSSLPSYSQELPGIKSKTSIFSLKFELCYVFSPLTVNRQQGTATPNVR